MHECLKRLYSDPTLSALMHDADYVEGVVFGVAAAPEIPMPDSWLVWTLKQRQGFTHPEHAEQVGEALLSLLRHQLALMRDNQRLLPERFECPQAPYTDPPLSRWMTGLLVAHQQLDRVWINAWERMTVADQNEAEALARDLAHCLKVFSTFADVPLALQQGRPELESNLPGIFNALGNSLNTYVQVSGDLAGYLPNQFETFSKNGN